jgi:hypothetical protein
MESQKWENPDDKPVVAHTPDPARYHKAGSDQAGPMRTGMRGVIIPRANNDGTSKGFRADEPGVVHVDPYIGDGGAVVDLSRLNKSAYDKAFQQSQYPSEVFYRLGQSSANLSPVQIQANVIKPTRENPLAPNSYVCPASKEDGRQYFAQQEQPMALPPLNEPNRRETTTPSVVSGPSQPTYAPPPQTPAPTYNPQMQPVPQYVYLPQPNAPDMSGLMSQLERIAGKLDYMDQRINNVEAAAFTKKAVAPIETGVQFDPSLRGEDDTGEEPVRSIPKRPKHPYTRKSEGEEIVIEEEPGDRLIIGFETLKMNFVTGPIPTKPQYEVFFELPEAGTINARYHSVEEGIGCLVLVYDTRYEDGSQYSPPKLGRKVFPVSVLRGRGQSRGDRSRNKEIHNCCSIGLHFSVGILDIVVLIKDPSDNQKDLQNVDD